MIRKFSVTNNSSLSRVTRSPTSQLDSAAADGDGKVEKLYAQSLESTENSDQNSCPMQTLSREEALLYPLGSDEPTTSTDGMSSDHTQRTYMQYHDMHVQLHVLSRMSDAYTYTPTHSRTHTHACTLCMHACTHVWICIVWWHMCGYTCISYDRMCVPTDRD